MHILVCKANQTFDSVVADQRWPLLVKANSSQNQEFQSLKKFDTPLFFFFW